MAIDQQLHLCSWNTEGNSMPRSISQPVRECLHTGTLAPRSHVVQPYLVSPSTGLQLQIPAAYLSLALLLTATNILFRGTCHNTVCSSHNKILQHKFISVSRLSTTIKNRLGFVGGGGGGAGVIFFSQFVLCEHVVCIGMNVYDC